MFYRKASSFTHPKILLHAECTNLRSCDRDVTSFLFTSIHYGNTFFFQDFKNVSHNYHTENWRNKPFHVIIKPPKCFFF